MMILPALLVFLLGGAHGKEGAAGHEVAVARPLTLAIPLSAEMEKALKEGTGGAAKATGVHLLVTCAPPTRANSPNLRIFLGKPDATAETPISDPHYVGSISLFPSPAPPGISEETYRYDFDVRALVASVPQACGDRHVIATLVALPRRPGDEPGTIEVLSVSLVRANPE